MPISLTEDQNAGMMRAVHRCLIHNTLLSPPEIVIELTMSESASSMPDRIEHSGILWGSPLLGSCAMHRCSNRSMASLDNFPLGRLQGSCGTAQLSQGCGRTVFDAASGKSPDQGAGGRHGVQLFDRTGARIALTEAGKILLDIPTSECPLRSAEHEIARLSGDHPETCSLGGGPPPPSPSIVLPRCWASSRENIRASPHMISVIQNRSSRRGGTEDRLGLIEGRH